VKKYIQPELSPSSSSLLVMAIDIVLFFLSDEGSNENFAPDQISCALPE